MDIRSVVLRASAMAILCGASLCAEIALDTNAVPADPSAARRSGVNLLKNSNFALGTMHWRLWQFAQSHTNWVRMVTKEGEVGTYRVLHVADPDGSLVGVQQAVNVVSGRVYRLSASAQSLATNASSVLFGGRVFFRAGTQPEQDLVWTTEFNQWWRKERIVTSRFTGTGLVAIHMGYGHQPSTGEFTDVRFERLQ